MSVHEPHPPINVSGLADDCDRCAEYAANPLDLDNVNLRRIIEIALDPNRLSGYYSTNDLVAAAKVLTLLEKFGRLAEVAPGSVQDYLRRAWRLDAVIYERSV